MKIKELIEKLKEYDENHTVTLAIKTDFVNNRYSVKNVTNIAKSENDKIIILESE